VGNIARLGIFSLSTQAIMSGIVFIEEMKAWKLFGR
jgi:hypothetical protein